MDFVAVADLTDVSEVAQEPTQVIGGKAAAAPLVALACPERPPVRWLTASSPDGAGWFALPSVLPSADSCEGSREAKKYNDPICDTWHGTSKLVAMDREHNLLVAGVALQAGLIDSQQFADACRLAEERPDQLLEDTLVERGWLEARDGPSLTYLLERALNKHEGNARAALASLASSGRRSLAALEQLDTESTVAGAPAPGSAPPRAAQALPPVDKRYRFDNVHATGGMGRVWRAQDQQLDREVAVKELLPDKATNSRIAARFLREARLTGQLEHPGIVPVYELTCRPGTNQPFYTMRFLKGRTLSAAIDAYHSERSAGEREPQELLSLLAAFVAVCNTVAYAHSRGVVHRDLKGDNVMLGDFGEVIVLDWGLAKQVDQLDAEADPADGLLDPTQNAGLTVQGEMVGTPAYMAPEQARGRLDQIDQRTDVHGLGAILYEILTGRPPFVGSSTLEVIRKAIRGDFPRPRELWPEAPPALEEACLKALAADPAQRYARAEDLCRDVERWQDVQRRRAEHALRLQTEELLRSRERFELAVRGSQDGLWDWDLRTGDVYYSPRWKSILGYEDHEIANRIEEWEKRLHPEERERVLAANRAYAEGITPHYEYEYRLCHKDGSYRWILSRGVALRDASGKAYRMAGSHVDITERKQAEQERERLLARERDARAAAEVMVRNLEEARKALAASEQQYRSLADLIPGVVWTAQADGSIDYANQFWLNYTGFTLEQTLGSGWAAALHPEDTARVTQVWTQALQTGELVDIKYRLRRGDGVYRWFLARGQALRDREGRIVKWFGMLTEIDPAAPDPAQDPDSNPFRRSP
jgi:eukaryotic-like serine/threonine-protein kinase